MANTLITPTIVARQALLILQNQLTASGLVYRGVSSEFAKVGDTVKIRKPASFTAAKFAQGTPVTPQDATETSVSVVVNQQPDVTFQLTGKDRALNVQDFSAQLLTPAVNAIAQAIDADVCALAKDIPYKFGTAGTAPATFAALMGAGRVLNTNKAPMAGRVSVMDEFAQAALLGDTNIINAEKSGSTDALRNAAIGRVGGIDNYMDQNVIKHTAGAGTVLIDNVAGYAVGDTAIHVDGVTTALKVGDMLTISGNDHVVTVASALSTADQDITVYPALKAIVANDAAVTLAASHTKNLVFLPQAFALATAPLEAPMGGANTATETWNGMTLRVVFGYDMLNKLDLVSIDCLYGVKTIQPELAAVLLG